MIPWFRPSLHRSSPRVNRVYSRRPPAYPSRAPREGRRSGLLRPAELDHSDSARASRVGERPRPVASGHAPTEFSETGSGTAEPHRAAAPLGIALRRRAPDILMRRIPWSSPPPSVGIHSDAPVNRAKDVLASPSSPAIRRWRRKAASTKPIQQVRKSLLGRHCVAHAPTESDRLQQSLKSVQGG
jgi:hypothetical protein